MTRYAGCCWILLSDMYDFCDVVGNGSIIKSIKAAVRHGHVGHAYIFDGPAGVGKKLIALAFAKALLCTSAVDSDGGACGLCRSCKVLEAGSHPDVIFVRRAKKSLGVDEVREQIVGSVNLMPYSGTRRVFIIEDADVMTVQAQNALLKTLEDGPKHAVFFLLSQNFNAFMPTVISRCVLYKIPPLSHGAVRDYLIGAGVDFNRAQELARHAAGSIGRGVAIARDEGFAALHKTMTELARDVDGMEVPAIFEAAKALESHKDRIGEALDMLCLYYRDVLVEKCMGQEAETHYIKENVRKIRIIEEARRKLNGNCNFLLTMEVMLLHLAGRGAA